QRQDHRAGRRGVPGHRRRDLLGLAPVLHGQAAHHGLGRSRREVQPALQGLRRQQVTCRDEEGPASAGPSSSVRDPGAIGILTGYCDEMRAVVMWLTIAGILCAGPVVVVIGLRRGLSTTPVEKKYRASGGGLVGVFDAVWSPSAHEAGMERDREQRRAI